MYYYNTLVFNIIVRIRSDKVNVKTERFKRVIAREISEEEQQKNIEAPGRKRSERAKRIDYRKQLK